MENKKKVVKIAYEDDLKQIGANIKSIRTEKKITQVQLASNMNMSNNVISKIEKGDSSMKVIPLIKIAKELNVSFFDIFRDTTYISTHPPKEAIDKISQLNERDQKILSGIINVFYRNQKVSSEMLESKSPYSINKKSDAFDKSDYEMDNYANTHYSLPYSNKNENHEDDY